MVARTGRCSRDDTPSAVCPEEPRVARRPSHAGPGLDRPKAAPVRAAPARRFPSAMQRCRRDRRRLCRLTADGSGRAWACPRRRSTRGVLHRSWAGRQDRIRRVLHGRRNGSSPDLVAVLEALARQADTLVPRRCRAFRRLYEARQPAAEDNDQGGSPRNIARHYDLSNDLFAAFLDETMTYSAALFTDEHATLSRPRSTRSSAARRHRGTARHPGARNRAPGGVSWPSCRPEGRPRHHRDPLERTGGLGAPAGVSRGIEQPGRHSGAGLPGCQPARYDAIVSVEMVEAVGERWWPAYFKAMDQCLAPGGRVGLQAITMAHDRLLATKVVVDLDPQVHLSWRPRSLRARHTGHRGGLHVA